MRILAKDTMAIVIDYQERLMPAVFESTAIIERATVLLKGLNLLEIPVIVTRQYPKGLGDTVEEIRLLTDGSAVYDKLAFSCYDDEKIKAVVDESQKKNVILLGIEAHVCVAQTMVDLCEAGYNVIYVTDCISSRKKSDRKLAQKRAKFEGAVLASTESILFELTRTAGTAQFKGISALVK